MNKKTDFESRLQKLEDIESIQKLTSTYALYVNKGWNGKAVDFDKLPAVFTSDARWESAAMQINVVGAEAIVEMLKKSTSSFDYAMHSFTNPIIEIAGDTATGHWLLWVGIKAGDTANEVFQSEDLSYIRTTQGWRIQAVNLHFGVMLK